MNSRRLMFAMLKPFPESDPEAQTWFKAFAQGMQAVGRSDGRNIRIDVRSAGGEVDRTISQVGAAGLPVGMTRQPTPEVIKLIGYRPDFFRAYMKKVTHEAMHGSSAWSVGDRELMAALVSRVNACEFCIKAHTAVAALAYGDEPKVATVLSDLEAAPVSEPLRAILRVLGKLTREQTVGADDIRSVLAAGVSRQQIEDALAICFAFNTINRLAETFAFSVPGPKTFEAGAKFLLARGYR